MVMTNPYNYTVPKSARIKMGTVKNPTEERIISNSKPRNGFDHYREQAILTARPEELTLMLYNGIIKFLKQGKVFIEEKNIEKAHNAIIRAQDIINELKATLNMDYEISGNLMSLYDFMTNRLIEANLKKDTKIIDEVLDIAVEMRDTWKEAMNISKEIEE